MNHPASRRSRSFAGRLWTLCLPIALAGCAADADAVSPVLPPATVAPSAPGGWPVGIRAATVTRADGAARDVILWYPAAAAEGRAPDAAPPSVAPWDVGPSDDGERAWLQATVQADPGGCASAQIPGQLEAPLHPALLEPDAARLPLLVLSHCLECAAWNMATVAARVAAHGVVVVAVDHRGNTMYDRYMEGGQSLGLTQDALETRHADVIAMLDALVPPDGVGQGEPVPASDDAAPDLAALRALVDPARVVAAGHSFGSITVGAVAAEDARVAAVAGLAAPMDNPLVPAADVATLSQPLLFVLSEEDNSILEIGNQFLRGNYDEAPGPAWLLAIADAGHWSFTDIAGLLDHTAPGCGSAERQTNPGEAFDYLPIAAAQAMVSEALVAFVRGTTGSDGADADVQAALATGPADSRATWSAK